MSTKIKTYKTTFKLRRGLSEEWTSKNPVLQLGEPGFETDTNKLKIGNGEDVWNDLPYLSSEGEEIVLKHSLTIGEHIFNGSEDVIIPIYDGKLEEEAVRELMQLLVLGTEVSATMTVVEREDGDSVDMSEARQFNMVSETKTMQLGIS